MAKMGRPLKEISQDIFAGLCRIQCTEEEIAGVLKVSVDTIERWCKRTYKETFAEVYKKLSGIGKMSLRRAQFKAAEDGNSTMLVWLGKQYLGQKDVQKLEHSGKVEFENLKQAVLDAMVQHRKDFPNVPESERLEWFAQDSGIDKTELVSEANN